MIDLYRGNFNKMAATGSRKTVSAHLTNQITGKTGEVLPSSDNLSIITFPRILTRYYIEY